MSPSPYLARACRFHLYINDPHHPRKAVSIMIVEYIRYAVEEARRAAFEQAYTQAQTALQASPHCLAYELSQCVEDPDHYILRIEWDSLEGHMEGFRKSAVFQPFFQAVRPFFNDIEEMRHYEVTAIRTV